MRPCTPLEEFYIKTPIGNLRVWCPETYQLYDVPPICIDFIHEDGDIPLTRVRYDYAKREVTTNAYADMYSDIPTHVAHHEGLNRL